MATDDTPKLYDHGLPFSEILGWKPRLNDLDTIVSHALAWEKRLIDYRAAS